MDAGESSLPDSINPNNFPAKLWRLVNNPDNKAISWDSLGKVIIIDQKLFECQILNPSTTASDNADIFKTTNFSSFVRQLNLYGFRKADPAAKAIHHCVRDSGPYHYFYNTNFKRNHPELVASLRRLTVDNKAKIQAGLNVNCRPPRRYQRLCLGVDGKDKNGKTGSSSLLSPKHQELPPPYYPNNTQAGTPVPPRYLVRGPGPEFSPAVHATEKGIPVSIIQHYGGLASSTNTMHIQQSLLGTASQGNPNVPTFNPHCVQCQPGFYSPVCQCYHPNLVPPHMLFGVPQTGLLFPHSISQAGYPVNMFSHGDHNENLQTKENQEEKKCDINLDSIFHIADEVMQTPTSNFVVKVVTPVKTGPVLEVSFDPNNAMICNTPGSTIKANPLCAASNIIGSADAVTLKQQEEYMVSVPEQMPEDAIFEVSSYSVHFLKVFSFIICKDKEVFQNEREKRKCNSLAEDLYIVCCCFLCAMVRLPVKKQRTLRFCSTHTDASQA